MSTAMTMAIPRVRKASSMTVLAPAISQVAPSGRSTLARAASVSVEAAPMLLLVGAPVMVAVRAESTRVTCTGVMVSSTVAMSPRPTMPCAAGTLRRSSIAVTAPGIGGRVISPTLSCAGSTPSSVGTEPSGNPFRMRVEKRLNVVTSTPAAAALAWSTVTVADGCPSLRFEDTSASTGTLLTAARAMSFAFLRTAGSVAVTRTSIAVMSPMDASSPLTVTSPMP